MKSFIVLTCLAVVLRTVRSEDCVCGEAGDEHHPYPWVVNIQVAQRTSNWGVDQRTCTGVLINSQYVLTSSDCVDGIFAPSVTVIPDNSDRSIGGASHRVDVIKRSDDDGIALLKLTERVYKTVGIKQICLPSSSNSLDKYKALYSIFAHVDGDTTPFLQRKDEEVTECPSGTSAGDNEICKGVEAYCNEIEEPLLASQSGKAFVAGILKSRSCRGAQPHLKYKDVSKYSAWIGDQSNDGECLTEIESSLSNLLKILNYYVFSF